jgi:hypothetical protein
VSESEECFSDAESFPGEDTSLDEDSFWYDDTYELVEDDERETLILYNCILVLNYVRNEKKCCKTCYHCFETHLHVGASEQHC